MTKSLAEAITGLSKDQVEQTLRAKGRNPEHYDVYPFGNPAYFKNRETGKIITAEKMRRVWSKLNEER